jgi:hypothetical protein
MADRIGVKRKWIQRAGTYYEHFDICKAKRALAVRHGAVEVDLREAGELLRRKCAAMGLPPLSDRPLDGATPSPKAETK